MHRCEFCCSYDDDIDQVGSYQKIPLEALEKIEIGQCVTSNCDLGDDLLSDKWTQTLPLQFFSPSYLSVISRVGLTFLLTCRTEFTALSLSIRPTVVCDRTMMILFFVRKVFIGLIIYVHFPGC